MKGEGQKQKWKGFEKRSLYIARVWGKKVETLGKIQEKPKIGKIDLRNSHCQEKGLFLQKKKNAIK